MSKIIIQIKGFQIHLSEDNNGQFKPDFKDIALGIGLNSLSDTETLKKLYVLLLKDQPIEACKLISYNEDLTLNMARVRILGFLLTSASCLITFGISDEQIEHDLGIFRDFISCINNSSISVQDVMEMIITNGYGIKKEKPFKGGS